MGWDAGADDGCRGLVSNADRLRLAEAEHAAGHRSVVSDAMFPLLAYPFCGSTEMGPVATYGFLLMTASVSTALVERLSKACATSSQQ